MNKKKYIIIAAVIICCVIFAVVDTVIEPPYAVKSALKIAAFLLLPAIAIKISGLKIFGSAFAIKITDVLKLLALGGCIYLIIIASYALTKGVFDYSGLVESLSKDQKVGRESFLPVAAYISFCNSFIEEFLFRQAAFIKLKELTDKRTAYCFSSLMFALYHVAMVGQSFPLPMTIISVAGLALGGLVFDWVDDKNGNIYGSWVIHMFADFALMTVWYVHI